MAAKKKPPADKVKATHTGEWEWSLGEWTLVHRSDEKDSFTLSNAGGGTELNMTRDDLVSLVMVGARALSDTQNGGADP
jgi:hypothetical protein